MLQDSSFTPSPLLALAQNEREMMNISDDLNLGKGNAESLARESKALQERTENDVRAWRGYNDPEPPQSPWNDESEDEQRDKTMELLGKLDKFFGKAWELCFIMIVTALVLLLGLGMLQALVLK